MSIFLCPQGHMHKKAHLVISCAQCKANERRRERRQANRAEHEAKMAEAAKYVNEAATPEERALRKVQVYPTLYGSSSHE